MSDTRPTTNWTCEKCGNPRTSAPCLGCEVDNLNGKLMYTTGKKDDALADLVQLHKENAQLDDDAIRLCAERDEARAEVERLKGVVEQVKEWGTVGLEVNENGRLDMTYPSDLTRLWNIISPNESEASE